VRADDTVGRISGDEFGIVLADLARAEDAALVGQKIIDALAAPTKSSLSSPPNGASVGISIFPSDSEDADALLRNADMAMYRAKETGRNRIEYFTPAMNDRTVAKLQLGSDLRRAIDRREFALHYQPKVNLETGALVGMEALLRWQHPQRGLVSPAEFIPALEESGLILPVGDWVVEETCAQIRRWQIEGLQPVPVAVNISAKQFRRQHLDRMVEETLAARDVSAQLLELEITESSLAEDPTEAVRILHQLREAGIKISIDDFGTGYSSLSALTRLPLSALKIDRSFVRHAAERVESAAIVRAIIDMAHTLGFIVVAEGVETEQQAKFLWLHKCDQGQGYLYARPEPADVVAKRLLRS
jgi:diguanylate cyclase